MTRLTCIREWRVASMAYELEHAYHAVAASPHRRRACPTPSRRPGERRRGRVDGVERQRVTATPSTRRRAATPPQEVANPKCDQAPGCGPWSPPKVDNPDYKGKWYPPQVDNPAYKGPWAPRKIPNKEFFEPKNPSKNLKPVGAVAVEVWTTNGGIAYDNFYLGGSEAEAKDSAGSYYAKKEEEEKKAAEKKAAKAAKRAAKGKGWRGLLLKAKKFSQTVLDKALDQPLAAGGTLLVLIITLLMTRKKTAVVEEDEAEEDDEEEEESEEEEEPAPRRGRRRTPKAD